MLVKLLSYLSPNAAVAQRWATASVNTNVVITLAALDLFRHTAHSVQWSYSGTPVGGKLTIQDGADTIEELDITAGGPGGFASTYASTVGRALTLTLASAGAGITGKLSCQTTSEMA